MKPKSRCPACSSACTTSETTPACTQSGSAAAMAASTPTPTTGTHLYGLRGCRVSHRSYDPRHSVGRSFHGNTNTGTDEVIHNIASIMRPNLRATGSTMPKKRCVALNSCVASLRHVLTRCWCVQWHGFAAAHSFVQSPCIVAAACVCGACERVAVVEWCGTRLACAGAAYDVRIRSDSVL
mgnify:CR=1 FL=1